ncbi:hypothetical protein ACVDG3_19065 [Meridianimarinicoccus sp. RP-17]|uniref:hypothetical protein n=1 Tax=Meridianimarinicoccus zhengii TaxID=2056810 RepID=UPI0013A6FE3A|nr:hypothetical protein [Phycocomes zhengii]
MWTSWRPLAAVLLISGCSYVEAWWPGPEDPPAADMAAPPEMQHTGVPSPEIDRWQAEWARSKREVAAARTEAAVSGRDIPPQVDAEVTELLDRDVSAPTDEERLRRLQDAVSDARRLAELVGPG